MGPTQSTDTGGSLHGDKAVEAWSWQLISIKRRHEGSVELQIHFPIHLRGATGTTFPLRQTIGIILSKFFWVYLPKIISAQTAVCVSFYSYVHLNVRTAIVKTEKVANQIPRRRKKQWTKINKQKTESQVIIEISTVITLRHNLV
jgi:hypothetical protein